MTEPPRGVFLANHNQDTGIRFWDLDRWRREIETLKAMGANTVWYLPFQFGQRSTGDLDAGVAHRQLMVDVGRAIADNGLSVGVYVGANDVFPESLSAHPGWSAQGGRYFLEEAHACPSVPAARAEIERLRSQLFEALPQIDWLMTPATDYGGCSCDWCAPWPDTYLDLLESATRVCRSHHPDVRVVAAGHGLPQDDGTLLRTLLPGADWIDYVADIPRGCGVPFLKYYMVPETTMLRGWGKYGMAPALEEIVRGYRQDAPLMGGAVCYSEGIHDDINRFACLQLAADPSRTPDDLAAEYVERWLGISGTAGDRLSEVILGLGHPAGMWIGFDPYSDPDRGGVHNPAADERVRLLWDAAGDANALETNGRYWLLRYRAVSEALSVNRGALPVADLVEDAERCRSRLSALEPEYGRFITELRPQLRPGEIPWVYPRTFTDAWAAEQSYARTDA